MGQTKCQAVSPVRLSRSTSAPKKGVYEVTNEGIFHLERQLLING